MQTDTTESNIFIAVGGIMLAFLVAWIIAVVSSTPLGATTYPAEGLGGKGVLDDETPVKEMEALLAEANTVTNGNYASAHSSAWWSRISDWIGFGLASVLTLLAGVLGKVGTPDAGAEATADELLETVSGKSRKWIIAVGVIAALSAISISVSSRLESVSATALEHADQLLTTANEARNGFINATSSAEGRGIVTELRKAVEKNR